MTALRARHPRWGRFLVTVSVVVATFAVYAPAAAATPTYHGGASAGWGSQEGDVLTANPGTWTSTTSVTYTYAWFNENSVQIGTGPTYTVAARDVGHQVYAAITASDGTPPSLTVNTPTVGPMRYRPPVNTEQPTVTGEFLQGSTLLATAGKWVSGGASTSPIEIGYTWYRGCTAGPKADCSNAGFIAGGSSLVLSAADLGRTISLSVTASYPDGAGGYAISSVWLGALGRAISSSVKAGDTLGGTVPWTVSAPGAETVSFTVGGVSQVVAPDAAGSAALALDTATLPNGSTHLAVTVAWVDGSTTTVSIGSVTIWNAANVPPAATPVIAKPVVVPRRPVAGARLVVTFAVTRSDNGRPLTTGKMLCVPSVGGKAIAHAESFRNGKARLAFIVPRAARHKLLKVKLTITLGSKSTTRISTFRVR